MYTPDKVAYLFLKFFVAMLIISLLVSISNIIPYYVQLNNLTNDLILRGAVNNYILQDQVDNAVKSTFTENDVFKAMTSDKGGGTVHVYADRQKQSDTLTNPFPSSLASGNVGMPNSGYAMSSKHVIVPESNTWDPKNNPDDMIKFRTNYDGAQRGDTITIRVESLVKGRALFLNINIPFEIPLAVQKSVPAMHYYRM